jgi:amino acid transporter
MGPNDRQEPSRPEGLTRAIGTGGVGLIVLNSMIGAGIFGLPAALASFGAWSPWLFVAGALAMSTVVLAFAQLASYFDHTGGPVLYTKQAFGSFVSFETGWLLYLGRVTALAANTNLLLDYTASLVPAIAAGPPRMAAMLLVFGALTWSNVAGVRKGMGMMAALTALKLLPLAVLVLAGLQYVTADAWWPDAPLPVEGIGPTALLLVYALIGFEGALVTAGETRDPTRTIPRAILVTVVAVGALYALIQLVYISLGSAVDPASATPLVDAARAIFGSVGVLGMTLAAVFSIGGNLSAIMVAAPRMTFALAFEGLLPRWFGHVRPGAATPDRSIVFLGVFGFVLAASGSFLVLAAMSSLTRMLAYAVSMAALPRIRRTRGEAGFRAADAFVAAALVLCLWVAAQSTAQGWITMAAFVALGAVLFAAGGRGRRQQT